MKIYLKSPVDFLAEAADINKKSTAFRMAKIIEKERIEDAYVQGFFDERNGKSSDQKEYYNKNYK